MNKTVLGSSVHFWEALLYHGVCHTYVSTWGLAKLPERLESKAYFFSYTNQRPARPCIFNDTDSDSSLGSVNPMFPIPIPVSVLDIQRFRYQSSLGSGDPTILIPIPVLVLEIQQFWYRFQSRFWRLNGSNTDSSCCSGDLTIPTQIPGLKPQKVLFFNKTSGGGY